MSYTELSVWTRGIIMDKEGRDIVNSVSASARKEGKYAQAMENYVDNPDRTNCPTRKYCRVSDSVLENELTYENDHPNIVVLVEGTMVKGWDYMRGMPPGGTLVINTHYTPEYMIRFVPGADRLAQLERLPARQQRLMWLQGLGLSYAEMAQQITGAEWCAARIVACDRHAVAAAAHGALQSMSRHVALDCQRLRGVNRSRAGVHVQRKCGIVGKIERDVPGPGLYRHIRVASLSDLDAAAPSLRVDGAGHAADLDAAASGLGCDAAAHAISLDAA